VQTTNCRYVAELLESANSQLQICPSSVDNAGHYKAYCQDFKAEFENMLIQIGYVAEFEGMYLNFNAWFS
jgi:hypothetical protein